MTNDADFGQKRYGKLKPWQINASTAIEKTTNKKDPTPMVYVSFKPAVTSMVFVLIDGELKTLLAKRGVENGTGKYGPPGGYPDCSFDSNSVNVNDASPAHTAAREAQEETGLNMNPDEVVTTTHSYSVVTAFGQLMPTVNILGLLFPQKADLEELFTPENCKELSKGESLDIGWYTEEEVFPENPEESILSFGPNGIFAQYLTDGFEEAKKRMECGYTPYPQKI